MKKALALILTAALALSLAACGGSKKPQEIELTTENIGNYISFSGEFTDSEYHQTILYYVSTSTIDFQAYSTAAGAFSNVEITLRANIDNEGAIGEKWHLADAEDTGVEFTFKMPSSGDYSHSYSIECDRNTSKLKGSCDFTVVSVSGTYTPAD